MKDHAVHIVYCVGWGMKKNFISIQKFLEEQFPELRGKITGGKYPVPPILELVENVMSMCQLVGMAWIVFGGQTLFRVVGFTEPPRAFYVIQEYGFQIGVGVFLLIPQLINQFAVSGAFEIVLDGQSVVWSKLNQGRFPSGPELISSLESLGLAQAQMS